MHYQQLVGVSCKIDLKEMKTDWNHDGRVQYCQHELPLFERMVYVVLKHYVKFEIRNNEWSEFGKFEVDSILVDKPDVDDIAPFLAKAFHARALQLFLSLKRNCKHRRNLKKLI